MTTLTLSGNGFRFVRNQRASSPTFQANTYYIKQTYASAIGFGDPVITLTGGNVGYVGAYAAGGTAILGVFVGLAGPYFDTVLNGPVNKNVNLNLNSGMAERLNKARARVAALSAPSGSPPIDAEFSDVQ